MSTYSFFCGVLPMHLNLPSSSPRSPLPSTVPAFRVRASQQKDKIPFRLSSQQTGQGGAQSLSYCLSTCRKHIRLLAGPCSSARILRPESCLGTCRRFSPKTCPLSCMPATHARATLLGLA
jgi:hypothetical protein